MNGVRNLADTVHEAGFAFVHGQVMRVVFQQHGSLADWGEFADSWSNLGLDTYMADGGRYRKRRHAAFAADARGIRRKPHQPHYQSRDYNSLNGGVARWFEPVLPEIAAGPTMATILLTCRALFEQLTPAPAWHIEVHQFRIEARADEAGRPTPEGTHQDGVDHVLVLLIGRQNIQSGVTTVTDLTRHKLGSFTLTDPCDAALVDDNRVMHGVTPVQPVDPAQPGFRDVLVVTFRREVGDPLPA
ncbi:MAG TPA: 2OG-Fe dioxygenase family protein [Acetobacteraceae bacterium]|nr:2OG-Fe dioxygenase family protein [Acetobacteraceae bacterium]